MSAPSLLLPHCHRKRKRKRKRKRERERKRKKKNNKSTHSSRATDRIAKRKRLQAKRRHKKKRSQNDPKLGSSLRVRPIRFHHDITMRADSSLDDWKRKLGQLIEPAVDWPSTRSDLLFFFNCLLMRQPLLWNLVFIRGQRRGLPSFT